MHALNFVFLKKNQNSSIQETSRKSDINYTSHLKRRETKDAQGSAHFLKIYKWVFKLTFKIDPKSPPNHPFNSIAA
jgi:hypothetical protein